MASHSRAVAMPIWLRYLLVAMAMAYIGLVLVVFVLRNFAPDDRERAALAVLDVPSMPVTGRDGSDAAWLSGRDVPEAERAAAARDLRRYLDRQDAPGSIAGMEGSPDVDPRERFPEFPTITADTPGACDDRDETCLATVRAQLPVSMSLLAANARGLRAALDLADHDGFRNGIAMSTSQEMPKFGRQRYLVRTHFAALHARGNASAAMEGICTDIRGWRRMGSDTDALIGSMIGAAYVRQDLFLMAEMLAEWPSDEALPPPCDQALAPSAPVELAPCMAMRSEFRMYRTALARSIDPQTNGPVRKLVLGRLLDPEHMAVQVAPVYAAVCDPALQAKAANDVSWRQLVPDWPECSLRDVVGDPAGCAVLSASGNTDWSGYFDRRSDQSQQLALMRVVLWLRAQHSERPEWPRRLAQRPPGLGLLRTPEIDADGETIAIPLFYRGRGKVFRLRLSPPLAPPPAQT